MQVTLEYGATGVAITVPDRQVTVLAPRFVPGLGDERAAFLAAVRAPLGARPLSEIVGAHERVAIVIADVTRPLPSDRLLPWVLEELQHVPRAQISIVIGTGSHRATTAAEIGAIVGAAIAAAGCRIVDHSAFDESRLAHAGIGIDGQPIYMNRDYVDADRRIVLGFVEPHFMAGFSGGYKAVFPGVADIAAIMRYHDARTIGDPRSTWGVLDGNPTQRRIRHDGALLPVDFCVNVTINRRRADHRVLLRRGHRRARSGLRLLARHRDDCLRRAVPHRRHHQQRVSTGSEPVSGGQGHVAAAQIVAPAGYIAAAARCNDGFPEHGNFKQLLFGHDSPRALLDTIVAPGFSMYDQWEAQLLAGVLLKARVGCTASCPPIRCGGLTSSRSRILARPWRQRSGASAPMHRLPCCRKAR